MSVVEVEVGIIVNGASGRMTRNQHLKNALVAIRDSRGVPLADGRRIVPHMLLVGRDAAKQRPIAAAYGLGDAVTSDLDAVLANPRYSI